eukprot:jgi/Hompol1/6543/HPOL_005018-RA
MSSTTTFDVVPEEVVTYSKEVQTDPMPSSPWDGQPDSPGGPRKDTMLKRRASDAVLRRKASEAAVQLSRKSSDAEMRPRDLTFRDSLKEFAIPEEDAEHYFDDGKVPDLSDQQKAEIVASEDFAYFFDRSTKIVERALAEDYDIMIDYTADTDEADIKETTEMKCVRTYSGDKITKNRSVTDVDWSSHYSELLLSSYSKNTANIHEPDGVVLIWNMRMENRPEFILHAQSDVMTARFSKFHHHTVIGGTYSGQIVIWDTRAKSMPVLKTSLSSPGHFHPVYSLATVGTQNANNIVSASTDGVVCTWQLDMLAQPQEIIELTRPTNSRTNEVAVSCLAFPDNESAMFWVGTEEGNVYQANRYERAGSKIGIDSQFAYTGHYGMITGIDFHPAVPGHDFQSLFLTSSVDWTVKLWKMQTPKTTGVTSGGVISCLHSFEDAEDYVCDVAWSPVRPGMFASVDCSGRFDLYNLAVSEMPIATEIIANRKAINKVAWDRDGRHVSLASNDGQVYVYDIGNLHQNRPEDAQRFGSAVKEFASAQMNAGLLDIRDDYLFYSNPVSREVSISEMDPILATGGIGTEITPSMAENGRVMTHAQAAKTGRDAGNFKGAGRNDKEVKDAMPALYDPFVRKQLSQLKTHYPWFLLITTIIQVLVLIASFVLNYRSTGSPIETNPFNYMIGPDSGTLIVMGARFVPCMKSGTGFDKANAIFACPSGITGSYYNGTVCSLLDLCLWGGFGSSGAPNQWFRFIIPIWLHGGIVHIVFNLSFQINAGFQLEKDMGWWRMAIIYLGSGIGGFIFGASLSDVRVPSVGASGALYGMVACLLLDLIQNWSLIKQPWIELAKMIGNIVFSLLLGTLPYIDNLAHVGGFASGICLGILFMPKIYFGKWDRRRKLSLMIIAFPLLVIFYALFIKSFYDGANGCVWCKYFNCLPGMPWCDQKFNSVTSVTINSTSTG